MKTMVQFNPFLEVKKSPYLFQCYESVSEFQLVFYNVSFFSFVLFCFVLRRINLIGHLMPNQVKENKSECNITDGHRH